MNKFNFKYVSSTGDTIETGKDYIYLSTSDLVDYEWNYDTKNEKITGFNKKVTQKQFSILIYGETEEIANAKKNRIYEIFDNDVYSNHNGKIYVGDYYLDCFIYKSDKSKYFKSKKILLLNVGVVSDTNEWIKEELLTISNSSGSSEISGLDYPYNYQYDYVQSESASINVNTSRGVKFKINIYGICDNPRITIGNNIYEVDCPIEYDEYLEINSKDKKVLLHKVNGEIETKFNYRNRDHYIFEPIPKGKNAIEWDNCTDFDVIIYDERSEPKWI